MSEDMATTELRRTRRKHTAIWSSVVSAAVLLIGLPIMLFLLTDNASASVISDIPHSVNDALLDGTSLYAARAILTAAIMASAGLALSVGRKTSQMTIMLVLMSVLGALTAIGWADITFLVIGILIVAGQFLSPMVKTIWGS